LQLAVAVAVPVLFSLLSSLAFGIGKFLFIFIMKLSITAIKEPQFITLKTKQKYKYSLMTSIATWRLW
jgi:hypothetical protein